MKDERQEFVRAIGSRDAASSSSCSLDGCTRSTREHKPYCPEHIEQLPYVQEILKQINLKNNELERIKKTGYIPKVSTFEEDIINHLKQNGARTVKRLARELNIDFPIIMKIVRGIKNRRKVWLKYTKRKEYVVGAR